MEKNINYEIDSKTELILKLLLIISVPILTIVLSTRFHIIGVIVGAFFSLYLATIIIIFSDKIKITLVNKKNCIISCLISCYMMKVFLSFNNYTIKILSAILKVNIDIVETLLGILALPSVIFIVYKFIDIIIPKVREFFASLTKVEIKYIQVILIISVVLSFFTIYATNAFTKPNDIDVIYTTDSLGLLIEDVYCNASHNQNDLRQPLFGIFSLPFGIIARIISELIFFVPSDYAYEYVMTIMQFVITTITTILIARLMKLQENDKKYLYLLFSCSFPYILFNLVLEQYVISLFYLILTIYWFYNHEGVNYAYIGATGSLITSGIMFPLITKFKSIKQYAKDILESLIIFISIFVISGQFSQLTIFEITMTSLLKFAKPLPFIDKVYQFLNFVQGIFFSCKGEISGYRYWLQEVNNISIIGIVLFVIIIISFIINRKETMAKVSFYWVIFSALVLVVVGWGTTENGLILYSLYFAWAYLCLYYLFLKKLCTNRKVFITLILITILIMTIFNLKEFLNIMLFAIKYH